MWFRIVAVVSLWSMLSMGGPAFAAGDDTAALTALRTEVIDLLRKERPATAPTVGREPWLVELRTGTLSILNLARTVEGLEGPGRRAEILRFADSALPSGSAGPESDFAKLRKRLRVQIAPAEYGAASSPVRALHRDFSEGLIVAYVVDFPDHIEYVRDDRPEAWKVDRETIERAAVDNLERRLRKVPIEVEQAKEGIGRHVIVSDSDGYGAARVLCPTYMARLHAKLGPHAFVAIPNRDVLLVWTPGHGARKRFVELVGELYGNRPHPLTRTVFVIDAGRLRPASAEEVGN